MIIGRFLGLSIIVWLFLLFGLMWIFIMLFVVFKEAIQEWFREKWYKIRVPEILLKIVVYFPNQYKKTYWRVIPDKDYFTINNLKYYYSEPEIIRDNDFFIQKDKDTENMKAICDGKTYNIDESFVIKGRRDKFPELHYFYNNPFPIKYSEAEGTSKNPTIKFTSQLYDELIKNDLIRKLLTLQQEKTMLMMLLIFIVVNMILSLVIIAKLFNLIKGKT
jgi:hypothetical protein